MAEISLMLLLEIQEENLMLLQLYDTFRIDQAIRPHLNDIIQCRALLDKDKR